MKHSVRRLAAVTALALTGSLVAAAPSQAAGPDSTAAAQWLKGELAPDGLLYYGAYASYGPTLDVFFALHDLGLEKATQDQIIAGLAVDPTAYTGGFGELYAGAHGKLVAAVQEAGGNPASFGGVNVVTELEGLVSTTPGDGFGRASDLSSYGDYSSTITQAWVVRALADTHSALTDEALSYLLKQQCTAGGFRSDLANAQCTTGEASVDSTALAIQGLQAASAAGQPGLAPVIAKAAAWLSRVQKADGSFGNPDSNANSTALAALSLSKTGYPAYAGAAAKWLQAHQVTAANAAGTALSTEVGAIAFDDAALVDGKTSGIVGDATIAQWQLATAQSAVALESVLAPKKITVSYKISKIRAGKKQTVYISGLVPREPVTVIFGKQKLKVGRASTQGTVRLIFNVGKLKKKKRVEVVGLSSDRAGSKPFWVK